jgi:hypothetical protein
MLDCEEQTEVTFDACAGTSKVALLSANDECLSLRGVDFDRVEDVVVTTLTYAEQKPWKPQIVERWRKGELREIYPTLPKLRHVCLMASRYGRTMDRNLEVKGLGSEFAQAIMGDDNAEVSEDIWNEILKNGKEESELTKSPDQRPRPDLTERSIPLTEQGSSDEKRLEIDNDTMSSICLGLHNPIFSPNSYFVTKRGYIGRSPMPAKVGDRICVFLGGKVPFLLWPKDTSNVFNLVGETCRFYQSVCFVLLLTIKTSTKLCRAELCRSKPAS